MATKLWVGTDTGNEGDWGTAANWSPSGVPANGDDVYIENTSQVIIGEDQSAVTLDSLNIAQSFTGTIGDDSTYLQIGATAVRIGDHSGLSQPAGSGRIKLDLGAAASAVVIENSANISNETNKPPIRIICNHASTTIVTNKGKVGIANDPGETSVCSYIATKYKDNQDSDADVYSGPGVTAAAVVVSGGKHTMAHAGPATVYGGKLITIGSGAITPLTFKNSKGDLRSTGTITLLTIDGASEVDCRRQTVARTIVTCNLDPGGTLHVNASLTITNGPSVVNNMTMIAS